VTAGTLNDLSRSLQVSVAVAGQLISVAAVLIALCAPLLAAVVAGIDRRRLLTLSLLWFAAWHGVSALMPSFAALLPVRAISVLSAAVFTPQAAAALGVMVPPAQRGQAITFALLGWSLASVLGMPLSAWIGETWGWRWAFGGVGLLALVAAAGVWRAMPDGVRPAALSWASWASVFTQPALMAVVFVTVLSAAGQFTLFSYFAPYYRQVLGASPAQISGLFLWFGAVGLAGNLLLTRHVDRIGARALCGRSGARRRARSDRRSRRQLDDASQPLCRGDKSQHGDRPSGVRRDEPALGALPPHRNPRAGRTSVGRETARAALSAVTRCTAGPHRALGCGT
jgi:predicted MFS family arabinose efflux permease